MDHLKITCEMAKLQVPDSQVELAVVGKKLDGSGQIVATFRFEEFLSDLGELLADDKDDE